MTGGEPAEELRRLYETMLAVRRLDERLGALAARGRIGPWAGAAGEEAVAVGAACALRPSDWIFPGFRDHGALLWRGRGLGPLVAQALGAQSAPAAGRALPLHHAWRDGKIASVPGAPGAHLPHAVGLAAGARMRGRDDVALALFGPGAVARGDFHAALELARALRAPVVFVCAGAGAAERAAAYGLAGAPVDGADVVAVVAKVREAADRARAGGGATILGATPGGADPVVKLRETLAARGLWSEAWEREVEARIDAELAAAFAAAEAAGKPDVDTLFQDVWARPTPQLEDQRADAAARAGRKGKKAAAA